MENERKDSILCPVYEFICDRITAGANIVRPSIARFSVVREHTVLPYGYVYAHRSLFLKKRRFRVSFSGFVFFAPLI